MGALGGAETAAAGPSGGMVIDAGDVSVLDRPTAADAAAGKLPERAVPSGAHVWAARAVEAAVLALACALACGIRLFPVARWGALIHEYDPWFNYRTTKFLASEGFYAFHNWFDDRSWYPLGRVVGAAVYPGLMVTAAAAHAALRGAGVDVSVLDVCVYLTPAFAAATVVATYLLLLETARRRSTALLGAVLVAVVPGFLSRSTAGSYDNEGVAIFAMVLTFYLWVRAVNTGSPMWACAAAVAYAYMAASWGGYVFIINVIPIYVAVMVVAGRYTSRLYVAYSTFYVLGSLLAMQVQFVGYNIVTSAECAASHGVFVLLQAVAALQWLRRIVSHDAFTRHVSAQSLRRTTWVLLVGIGAVVAAVGAVLIARQVVGRHRWTGRSLSLLNPTHARVNSPIISSVAEHQPTAWPSFFFDLHLCVPFAPVGLYFLFDKPTDGKIFLILYGTVSWYFAGVMVRLMVTLAPAACMLAAVGVSALLNRFTALLKHPKRTVSNQDVEGSAPVAPYPRLLALLVVVGVGALLVGFASHSIYVANEAYSSPNIVLKSRRADGSVVILDDYRETYAWIRNNTEEDAKVMAWWDYGYQLAGMANRTTIVDNNTWNNTHIATVGRALVSNESAAYPILRSLDVDYIVAVCGALTGYHTDDINKMMWMIRIAQSEFPGAVNEQDYLSANGAMRVDAQGSPALLNSLLYKMCYFGFDEVQTDYSKPLGFDRVRQAVVGGKDIHLSHVEEAYTSSHWMLRVFKVLPPPNRHRAASLLKDRDGAAEGRRSGTAVGSRFVGCFASERSFSDDRVYAGAATGAAHELAQHHAVAHGLKYFAIARGGADGHVFAFDRLLQSPDRYGPDCNRGCLDNERLRCGCADAACRDVPPQGTTERRAWAVYEVTGAGGPHATRPAAGLGASGGPPAATATDAPPDASSAGNAQRSKQKSKKKKKAKGKKRRNPA